MRRLAGAFTLVELLVVVAIVSILAAITFPVMNSAKGAAQRTVCMSNMRQIAGALNMYAADYDDYFVLTSQQPGPSATSRTDRTWVQLVLPYTRSFAIFHCPSDYSERPKPEATFDQDLVPGDTDSRYYTASMHTDYALNYQYLSPIVSVQGVWEPQPKPMTTAQNPSRTIMLVESVWTRLPDGTPYGGGNWLVDPPCRYYQIGHQLVDSFQSVTPGRVQVYTTSIGWSPQSDTAPNQFGNAWPWHNGRINTALMDGSVRSISPNELTVGCKVQPNWQGPIVDISSYLWDTR